MRRAIPVNITMANELKEAAEKYSRQNYTKISQVIRDLLTEKLKKEGYLPNPSQNSEEASA
jgi:hypothetical protein